MLFRFAHRHQRRRECDAHLHLVSSYHISPLGRRKDYRPSRTGKSERLSWKLQRLVLVAPAHSVASSYPYHCKRLPKKLAAPTQVPDCTVELASAWDGAGNSLPAPRLLPVCSLASPLLHRIYLLPTPNLPLPHPRITLELQ